MERGTVLLYLLNGAVCRTKWAEEEGKKAAAADARVYVDVRVGKGRARALRSRREKKE